MWVPSVGDRKVPNLAKTLAPWTAELTFTTRPILPIQETAEINAEALGWRDAN